MAVLTSALMALASIGGVALVGGSDAPARPPTEAHVTGNAWVRYSRDPGNPLRQFVVDAHGGPYRVVDGKLVIGAARGTIRINHPIPDPDGVPQDHWSTVAVDYVMTGGPVAIVSGTAVGDGGQPKGTRLSFSVYDDPRGRRLDRLGFSWGVVDGRCVRMGLAPAPFTPYASGPGYQVRHAELPEIPADVQPPDEPPACLG